jgi:hypothetical protein
VLLIQRRLRNWGIQSELMTAGTGTDFLAYGPNEKKYKVHVMACQEPNPAGGKGRPSLGWNLSNKNCAQLVGLANLDGDQAWLFRRKEYEDNAQQKPKGSKGKFHLYFYVEPKYLAKRGSHERDFELFVINGRRIQELFGIPMQTETPPKGRVVSSGSKLAAEFKARPGTFRRKLLVALEKSFGKQVAISELCMAVYGSDSKIGPLMMCLNGAILTIVKEGLPYEIKKEKGTIGIHAKKPE